MCIKEDDLISCDISIVFYYKNCEITLRKLSQVCIIKITGISDFGNLISVSRVFRKKHNRKLVLEHLKSEINNIKKVYKSILDKEYGANNHIQ